MIVFLCILICFALVVTRLALAAYAVDNESWAAGILCVVLLAGAIAFGVCEVEQEDDRPFDGYVAQKQFHPSSTNFVFTGKIMVPITTPDRWNVIVRNSQGDSRSCDISSDLYTAIQLGENYHCGN